VNGQISTPPFAPKKAAGKAVTRTKVQGFFLQRFLQKFFIKNGQVLFSAVKLKVIGTYNSITSSDFPADTVANSAFFVKPAHLTFWKGLRPS